MSRVSNESLREDLEEVVRNAEELLRATAHQAGERVAAARDRTEESVRSAKARLATATDEAISCATQAADRADTRIRSDPWKSIGVGAVAGLVIGLLLGQRDGKSK